MKYPELTLEILDKAIAQIKASDKKIIGFRLHPSDLRAIRQRTTCLVCLDNNTLTITPPYRGMRLDADYSVPPGFPQPIRGLK